MKIRSALLWISVWVALFWFLIPAAESWYFGRDSMIRFDPKISRDYNCIFVEGHSAKSFTVPWLSRSTPVQYIRLRYAPNDDKQEYGIMFVEPRTLAYEAHDCCAVAPVNPGGRLSSPQPILDWIRSQPHAALADSNTNDAAEIFNAINTLASCDLEHFTLQTNVPLQNFVISHQWLAKRGPDLSTGISLFLFCLSLGIGVVQARKSTNQPKG